MKLNGNRFGALWNQWCIYMSYPFISRDQSTRHCLCSKICILMDDWCFGNAGVLWVGEVWVRDWLARISQ